MARARFNSKLASQESGQSSSPEVATQEEPVIIFRTEDTHGAFPVTVINAAMEAGVPPLTDGSEQKVTHTPRNKRDSAYHCTAEHLIMLGQLRDEIQGYYDANVAHYGKHSQSKNYAEALQRWQESGGELVSEPKLPHTEADHNKLDLWQIDSIVNGMEHIDRENGTATYRVLHPTTDSYKKKPIRFSEFRKKYINDYSTALAGIESMIARAKVVETTPQFNTTLARPGHVVTLRQSSYDGGPGTEDYTYYLLDHPSREIEEAFPGAQVAHTGSFLGRAVIGQTEGSPIQSYEMHKASDLWSAAKNVRDRWNYVSAKTPYWGAVTDNIDPEAAAFVQENSGAFPGSSTVKKLPIDMGQLLSIQTLPRSLITKALGKLNSSKTK